MGISDQITMDKVNSSATALGFKFVPLGGSRYKVQLVFNNTITGIGYQGNLVGCHAYLQGWSEYKKFLDSLSFHG